MIAKEEAARREPKAATNCTTDTPYYSHQRPASRPFAKNLTVVATGSLLLYLLGRSLPLAERALCWQIVDRWVRQMIEAKHTGGAAV